VYGSSRGGTAGLARMIAEAFVANGIVADLGDAAEVGEPDDYDVVVIGGALYSGRWHADAAWFVERNLASLLERQVWFFSSGPLDDSARSGSLAPVDQVRELARRADIRGHTTFGGVLEKPSGGFFANLLAWGKPGDFRDPRQVAEYVERVITRFGESGAAITLPVDGSRDAADRPPPGGPQEPDDRYDDADDLGLDVLTDSDH
jgi:menaquinone-dependent protoporphyrinogen oxidase